MRHFYAVLGRVTILGLLCAGACAGACASALAAQTLEEVCPGAGGGTGALWGIVSDTDAQMALPGATVVATWRKDGTPGRAEVQSAPDGEFKLCYVPLDIDLTVQPTFANMPGQVVIVRLMEPINRLDLGFSLSGPSKEEEVDVRIWACLGGTESQLNLQNSRLFRCDAQWMPLAKCPREELGTVMANAVGAGSGMMREMLETIWAEARRLGANALINFRIVGGRGSFAVGNSQRSIGTLRAVAVRIEVDPSTC